MKRILFTVLIVLLVFSLSACGGEKSRQPASTSESGTLAASNGAFTEKEVTIGTDEWKVPGTLLLPQGSGSFPVVVLVHGSGPSDRNETIGPNTPFKDIAEGLASHGIASLRFDKRTLVHGKKMAGIDITVKEESIDDAVLAYELLKQTDKIDPARIYIAGHSLGGSLIPRIAERTPDAAGYIILAGNARPLEDLILEQTEYLLSITDTMTDDQKKAQLEMVKGFVDRIRSLKPGDKVSAAELMGAPSSYWLDLQGYKPAKLAEKIEKPLLIQQGGRDYQVTKTDFDLWKAGLSSKTNVTFKFYDDLNHLFMTGEGKSTLQEYNVKGKVSDVVITDMARFINGK